MQLRRALPGGPGDRRRVSVGRSAHTPCLPVRDSLRVWVLQRVEQPLRDPSASASGQATRTELSRPTHPTARGPSPRVDGSEGWSPLHPRVCGAAHLDGAAHAVSSGSSPRVRGSPLVRADVEQPRGFIPACAGQPRSSTARPDWSAVHPRLCGAALPSISIARGTVGSFPRVRGSQRGKPAEPTQLRFIPACAGQPWRGSLGGWSPRSCRCAHPRVCVPVRGGTKEADDSNHRNGGSERVRAKRRSARRARGPWPRGAVQGGHQGAKRRLPDRSRAPRLATHRPRATRKGTPATTVTAVRRRFARSAAAPEGREDRGQGVRCRSRTKERSDDCGDVAAPRDPRHAAYERPEKERQQPP